MCGMAREYSRDQDGGVGPGWARDGAFKEEEKEEGGEGRESSDSEWRQE